MRYIDKQTAEKWQSIAERLGKISNLAQECYMILCMELNITDSENKAMKVITAIEHSVNGQSYMFTPQSEWMGGENFKIRPPHICKE